MNMQTPYNAADAAPQDIQARLEELRRKVSQLERDNRMLAVMNQNAETLRRSYEVEKKLRYLYDDLFLDNCSNMIFLFNEHLQFVISSTAARALLADLPRGQLVSMPFQEVFSAQVSESLVHKLLIQNQDVLVSLINCAYDETITFQDGSAMHVQIMIAPIIDENHHCRGTVMTVNDVTALNETKKRAEEAARSKSSFLANMSHEIRTPMNAVKGLSELLALTDLNSLQRNYVTNIIGSANSLLGIINDVLDFSKIDANKVDFIEGPYNLAELTTGVCNVVNIRANDKDLVLMIDAAPDLPRVLHGDDVRVKQIITNILTNAVKYTNAGYVKLVIRMEDRGGVPHLVCAVEDSGIGIKTEDLPHLFNAFSRLDLQRNRSIMGAGLGLAISRHLAVAMGGDIEVASVYGHGSTFTFHVPQKIVDPQPIAQVENCDYKHVLLLDTGKRLLHLKDMLDALRVAYTIKTTAEAETDGVWEGFTHCIFDENHAQDLIRGLREQSPECRFGALRDMRRAMDLADYHDAVLYLPLFISDMAAFLNQAGHEIGHTGRLDAAIENIMTRDVRVLVVDDNEINLVVSSELLRSFGAEVLSAADGDEAIQRCHENQFDIIFMDHMMPGKDGIETAMAIRAGHGTNCKTPIVALTANVVNDMQNYFLQNGMDDFIGKPIEINDLARVLRDWLPAAKIVSQVMEEHDQAATLVVACDADKELITPDDLIAVMDNFGLYASDVMREVNGNFDIYVNRMEEAGEVLGELVNRLKLEMTEKRWSTFAQELLTLHGILYGIGARDCAGRARKLAFAACERNIAYINDDFFSLMGNMYMLDKKLVVIVPLARSGNLREIPLNVPQALHGCLEKLGRALRNTDAVEAMVQLANTAAISLDRDLDMALKAIKLDLEQGDFAGAIQKHTEIFSLYTERLARLDADSALPQ